MPLGFNVSLFIAAVPGGGRDLRPARRHAAGNESLKASAAMCRTGGVEQTPSKSTFPLIQITIAAGSTSPQGDNSRANLTHPEERPAGRSPKGRQQNGCCRSGQRRDSCVAPSPRTAATRRLDEVVDWSIGEIQRPWSGALPAMKGPGLPPTARANRRRPCRRAPCARPRCRPADDRRGAAGRLRRRSPCRRSGRGRGGAKCLFGDRGRRSRATCRQAWSGAGSRSRRRFWRPRAHHLEPRWPSAT